MNKWRSPGNKKGRGEKVSKDFGNDFWTVVKVVFASLFGYKEQIPLKLVYMKGFSCKDAMGWTIIYQELYPSKTRKLRLLEPGHTFGCLHVPLLFISWMVLVAV